MLHSAIEEMQALEVQVVKFRLLVVSTCLVAILEAVLEPRWALVLVVRQLRTVADSARPQDLLQGPIDKIPGRTRALAQVTALLRVAWDLPPLVAIRQHRWPQQSHLLQASLYLGLYPPQFSRPVTLG
mmetsp:Transcript_30667/g.79572  ORF Transcript_30667/g.79572 Transcript_30667/m.79572 type:complete len:128 (-) Transcript_30667:578-961(-)